MEVSQKVDIPEGKILVVTRDGSWDVFHSSIHQVTPALLKEGVLLSDGETTKVRWSERRFLRVRHREMTVKNVRGQIQQVSSGPYRGYIPRRSPGCS